jgi:hypothetical protein
MGSLPLSGHKTKLRLLMALLCLLVLAQSAAFASANEMHRSQDHCCLLCHVGPLPFLHTAVLPEVAPVLAVVWLEFRQESEATHEPQLAIRTSRGPPLSLPS